MNDYAALVPPPVVLPLRGQGERFPFDAPKAEGCFLDDHDSPRPLADLVAAVGETAAFAGLAEDYVVDPDGPGRCTFRWSVAIEPSTLGKAGTPVNGLLFRSFFADTTRYFGATEIG